jgi:hypothetical protein
LEEFARIESETEDLALNTRPLLGAESFALESEETITPPRSDEHASPATLLDDALFFEHLKGTENGQGIQVVVARDRPHRRERISVVKKPVEDHSRQLLTHLEINGGFGVPCAHWTLQLLALWKAWWRSCVVVMYIGITHDTDLVKSLRTILRGKTADAPVKSGGLRAWSGRSHPRRPRDGHHDGFSWSRL